MSAAKTRPFDLDAVVAEQEPPEPFEFTFGGETYSLPGEPDVRAFAALTAERLDEGLRLLLGAEQWKRMQDSPAHFRQSQLEALIVAYGAHVGADVGESQASSS